MTSPRSNSAALLAAGREHATRGDWSAAADCFRAVWRAEPANLFARHALATALLGMGDYREGFPLYALRRELPQFARPPALPCPEWMGEPLKGRHVLLFPEQGLGDQIQFARFAPYLARAGADVTLFCAPTLSRLFESLGVRVIAAAGQVEFPDPDYWAFSIDVPARLGLDLTDIPAEPYLRAPPDPRVKGGVGLMRRGNPAHENDANRSMPADAQPSFQTISLAPEDTGATDMFDTARIVAGLDAVVTVDTAVAHLAGAMGRRTLVMLPAFACDWRWRGEGDDSPWYPSMRLFRQQRPGDWSGVLARVERSLREIS